MVEFWAWIENQIVEKGKSFTEVEVADRLEEFRAKQQGFLDTSFETIAGSGPNGAVVHYRAEPSSCAEVSNQKLFLLDSGAQYVDGTTDITRTVHFGSPSAREKECFTRVLQVVCCSFLFELLVPVLDAFCAEPQGRDGCWVCMVNAGPHSC